MDVPDPDAETRKRRCDIWRDGMIESDRAWLDSVAKPHKTTRCMIPSYRIMIVDRKVYTIIYTYHIYFSNRHTVLVYISTHLLYYIDEVNDH